MKKILFIIIFIIPFTTFAQPGVSEDVKYDGKAYFTDSVGIGTINPTERLELLGNSLFKANSNRLFRHGGIQSYPVGNCPSYGIIVDSAYEKTGMVGFWDFSNTGGDTSVAYVGFRNHSDFKGQLGLSINPGGKRITILGEDSSSQIVAEVDETPFRYGVSAFGKDAPGAQSTATLYRLIDSVSLDDRVWGLDDTTLYGLFRWNVDTDSTHRENGITANKNELRLFSNDSTDGSVNTEIEMFSDRADIHISANVGIGTTTPAQQLHTTGNVRFGGLSGTDTILGIDGNGDLFRVNSTSISPELYEENATLQFNATVTGDNAVVIGGQNNDASAQYSFVGGGNDNEATGRKSFIGGGASNTASGLNSFTGGINNTARSYAEVVFGINATTYTPNETTSYNSGDRLFNIANGELAVSSDAFTILKSGVTGVGFDNLEAETDTALFNVNGESYFVGNVGIGTASPGYTLETRDTFAVTNTTNYLRQYIVPAENKAVIETNEDSIQIGTSSLYVFNDGSGDSKTTGVHHAENTAIRHYHFQPASGDTVTVSPDMGYVDIDLPGGISTLNIVFDTVGAEPRPGYATKPLIATRGSSINTVNVIAGVGANILNSVGSLAGNETIHAVYLGNGQWNLHK